MGSLALLLFFVTGLGVLFGPRKVALASFLVGCCYMTAGEGIAIAGFNFPVFRLLLLLGVSRVIVSGKELAGGINRIDRCMLAWAAWVMFASLFHEWAPGSGPKYMAGAVFNVTGFYLMIRSFCREEDDLEALVGILCWVLAPVAVLMVVEQAIQYNLFSVFGGVPEVPAFRNGRFRAQGPFNHAILAGTVGAGCIPLVLATWNRNRPRALVGFASCLLMVVACASSGPIMTTIFGMVAMGLWWRKSLVRLFVKAAIPAYIALALVMERPPYYLISKIDLTGSSTGWHRSFLIEQTIKHLSEWWLFGTDRTVHWMPNQGRISDNHTDVTNQYIAFGVNGGLLSMALFIFMIWTAFRVAERLQSIEGIPDRSKFLFWAIGASLFSHVASGMSVSYFGQAQFFFWLPIICLASFYNYGRGFDEQSDVEKGPVEGGFGGSDDRHVEGRLQTR